MKIAIPLLLLLASCGISSPPRQAAEQFLDAYYVNIDLVRAGELTEGYARTKIEEGKKLTEGQVIDATTRRPVITYTLSRTDTPASDEVNLLYELTIAPPGVPKTRRQVYIKTRQTGGVWRVALFREL